MFTIPLKPEPSGTTGSPRHTISRNDRCPHFRGTQITPLRFHELKGDLPSEPNRLVPNDYALGICTGINTQSTPCFAAGGITEQSVSGKSYSSQVANIKTSSEDDQATTLAVMKKDSERMVMAVI